MEFNDERTWNMGKFSHFKSSKGRVALVFAMFQKLSNNLYALWTGNVLDEYFVQIYTPFNISQPSYEYTFERNLNPLLITKKP